MLKTSGYLHSIHANSAIDLSKHEYLERVQQIAISIAQMNKSFEKTTPSETHAYCSLIETLLYLDQAVLRQACMNASNMQQQLGSP